MIPKIHELFNPKGFFAALWPYRYSSVLFGHCNSGSGKLRVIYTIAIVFLSSLSSYFIGYDFHKYIEQGTSSQIQEAVASFHLWFESSTLPMHSLVWFFVGHKCYLKIVRAVTMVDQELIRLCREPLNLKTMVIRQLICLVLSVSIPVILIFCNIKGPLIESNWWRTVEISVIRFPWIVSNVMVTFFANLVHLIGDRYALVNSVLRQIDGRMEAGKLSRVDFDEATITRQLRIVHRKLFFISKIMIKAFGFQLLVSVFSNFLSMMSASYHLYLMVSSCNGIAVIMMFVLVFRIVNDLSIIVYLAHSCHRTVREANGTTKILNSLMINSEELRLEVCSFSYQLMHYELHFSPLGLFPLDLALVQSVVGSEATYFVILVQLESINFDCLQNTTDSQAYENQTTRSTDHRASYA